MSLVTVQSLVAGSPLKHLAPAVPNQVPGELSLLVPQYVAQVYLHGSTTPATVYQDPLGASPLVLPLVFTDPQTVPGWVDNAVDLDLEVGTATGAQTLHLTPSIPSSSVVLAVTQSATPAINTDNCKNGVASITALAQTITSMTTNLTGSPADGQTLVVRITDNGTGRAITWGASFEASTVALPTTTVASAMLMVGFIWNSVTSKWRCVAVA